MPAAGFKLVGEDLLDETPPPKNDAETTQRNMQLLLLSLRVVGQRFVIGISHLFTAAMVASALFLWWSVLPSPTVPQLIGLGMWAAFILAVEVIRRKQ